MMPERIFEFVRRGQLAQQAVDDELERFASGPGFEDPVCIACGCWDLDACSPPCSWRSETDLPLCSSCAPPLVLAHDPAGDLLDVDDVVLEIVTHNPHGVCPADLRYVAPQYGVHADDVDDARDRLIEEGCINYRSTSEGDAALYPGDAP